MQTAVTPGPTAAVLTDRSVYKPNETVFVKGYVRAQHGGEMQPPTLDGLGACSLAVQWRRGGATSRQPVSLSPSLGSFDASLRVPLDASYAEHVITFSCPNSKRGLYKAVTLAVADPRPPTVEVNPERRQPLAFQP